MPIVVDASAMIDVLLGVGDVVDQVLRHELHAPVSIDAEVLHGLRRKWLARLATDDDAITAIEFSGR